jgi:hypothetical protein
MNSSVTTSVHAHSAGRLDVPATAYKGSVPHHIVVEIKMHTMRACWDRHVQHVCVTCIAPDDTSADSVTGWLHSCC